MKDNVSVYLDEQALNAWDSIPKRKRSPLIAAYLIKYVQDSQNKSNIAKINEIPKAIVEVIRT